MSILAKIPAIRKRTISIFCDKLFSLFFLSFFSFFVLTIFCHHSYSKDIPDKEILSEISSLKTINFEEDHLSLQVSQPTEFKIFTISNPQRVVIDLKNTKFSDNFEQKKLPNFIKNFRFRKTQNDLRIVYEVDDSISTKNSTFDNNSKLISCELFNKKLAVNSAQKPEKDGQSNEIVKKIEKKLDSKNTAEILEKKDSKSEIIIEENGNAVRKYKLRKNNEKSGGLKDESQSKLKNSLEQKNHVIVIDAGHGGKDPGTIGVFARSKEKNVTLAYAKELAKILQQNQNYKIFLTRNSDEFLPLKERVSKARQKKADLFISIHANATDDRNVSGFSIYTLSEKSSDKQAELLAQKENQADIINGIDFSKTSKDIAKTLIDLAQRESKNSSSSFAKLAIDEIKEDSEIEILGNTHRFAGFMVLTAPDMASVLIELGYLSNKAEEKLINSIGYRRLVAKKLSKAIDRYFEKQI